MLLANFSKRWWKTFKKTEDVSGEQEGAVLVSEEHIKDKFYAQDDKVGGGKSSIDHDAIEDEHGDEKEYPIDEDEVDVEENTLKRQASDDVARDDVDEGFDEIDDLDADVDRPDSGRGRGGRSPWRNKISSSKEFFSAELIYRFDILEVEERKKLLGSYRVELRGYNGGVWTINVGDKAGDASGNTAAAGDEGGDKAGDGISVVNRREDAQIIFSMQQNDFLRLINGELNVQLALLAQKLKITGDLKKGFSFLGILIPPRS